MTPERSQREADAAGRFDFKGAVRDMQLIRLQEKHSFPLYTTSSIMTSGADGAGSDATAHPVGVGTLQLPIPCQ